MKEFITKLIERLEEINYNDIQIVVREVLEKYGFPKESVVQDEIWDELDGLCTSKPAIEIVIQLAEEYNNESVKGDLINKSAAIDVIWDVFNQYCNDSDRFDEYETEAINRAFKRLQSTLEKQPTSYNDGWIPCSERLPECENKYGWVSCIVSVIRSHYPTSTYDICDSPYDENIVMHANYHVSQKIWHLDCDEQLNALMDIEDAPLNCDYVIAWMPLPPAYQPKEESSIPKNGKC